MRPYECLIFQKNSYQGDSKWVTFYPVIGGHFESPGIASFLFLVASLIFVRLALARVACQNLPNFAGWLENSLNKDSVLANFRVPTQHKLLGEKNEKTMKKTHVIFLIENSFSSTWPFWVKLRSDERDTNWYPCFGFLYVGDCSKPSRRK